MPNPYLTSDGREAFRKEFPADSGVVPLDILPRAHLMLRAIEEKEYFISSLDREVVAMLRQAVEHPSAFASTNDGLHTLFYANLHLRGAVHGDSSIWRQAVRRAYPGDDGVDTTGVRRTGTMGEYAKVLWAWVEAFDAILAERKA